MFAPRYWSSDYWARRYWNGGSTVGAISGETTFSMSGGFSANAAASYGASATFAGTISQAQAATASYHIALVISSSLGFSANAIKSGTVVSSMPIFKLGLN